MSKPTYTEEMVSQAVLDHYLETGEAATTAELAARVGCSLSRLCEICNLSPDSVPAGCDQSGPPTYMYLPERERLREVILELRKQAAGEVLWYSAGP